MFKSCTPMNPPMATFASLKGGLYNRVMYLSSFGGFVKMVRLDLEGSNWPEVLPPYVFYYPTAFIQPS